MLEPAVRLCTAFRQPKPFQLLKQIAHDSEIWKKLKARTLLKNIIFPGVCGEYQPCIFREVKYRLKPINSNIEIVFAVLYISRKKMKKVRDF